MSKPETRIICKNIFKDGHPDTSKEKFTDIWIRLISRQEQQKGRDQTK